MKLSQLLAGTAAVALLAGASFAQTAVVLDSGIDAGGDYNPGNIVDIVPELDFVAANLTANLEVALQPNANDYDLYTNTAAQITITFDGFELAGNIAGGSITSDWDANNASTNANCALSVVAGGASGDTSVTFETANLAACDDAAGDDQDDMGFILPVRLTGLPASFSFEIRQKANNALIASGDFDANNNNNGEFVRAGGGFEVSFDTVNAGNDMIALLANPAYNTLDSNGAGQIDFNANGDVDLNGNAGDWEDGNQVDGISVSVTLSNPSGIESVTIDNGNNNMTANLVNGVAVFDIDGTTDIDIANINNGLDVTLNIDNNNNTLIGNGTVSVSVTTDEDSASDLTIAGAASAADETNAIVREGTTTDTFEWVGDSTKSTANLFRVTGLGSTVPVIRVTLDGSTNDMDGEYTVTPTGALNNGELIITTANVTDAVGGNFGRADISFSFEANGLTVRRLMVTSGVVTENSTDF
jgi:hypothetical protein